MMLCSCRVSSSAISSRSRRSVLTCSLIGVSPSAVCPAACPTCLTRYLFRGRLDRDDSYGGNRVSSPLKKGGRLTHSGRLTRDEWGRLGTTRHQQSPDTSCRPAGVGR